MPSYRSRFKKDSVDAAPVASTSVFVDTTASKTATASEFADAGSSAAGSTFMTSTSSAPGNTTTLGAADGLRPNIIWIMADDLGWGEVGLFPAKSTRGRLRTPNLDQFGREGLVFRHAYAGYCVCAPSRMTFFTGRHSGRFKSLKVDGMSLRPGQMITFTQLLQSAGYATAAFGKISPLTSPLEQGFDMFLGQVSQGLCHNMYPKQVDRGDGQLNFELLGNFAPKSRELCMQHPEKYNYTIDVFHEAAMSWMMRAANQSRPFFLYMSYTIPHAGGWGDSPQMPESGQPVPLDMGYREESWPEVERDHAAVVTYMDLKVGQLMQQLKLLGIDQQTICSLPAV